jgi:hypothetical protein
MWLLINGTIWIYLSYLLAYVGKEEIAETLSKTVVIEILGITIIYAVKSLCENLSKNNNWPDKYYEKDKAQQERAWKNNKEYSLETTYSDNYPV